MGKSKPISEHVKQKSIGLRLDQWEFFAKHPKFNIAEFTRYALDKRIEVILDQEKENETTE